MIVGEYPFPNQGNIILLFEDISNANYKIPNWVDPLCSDLIKKMLNTQPKQRIDLEEIKNHPWMTTSLVKTDFPKIQTIPSLWGQDKASILSVIKKMEPKLKKSQEKTKQNLSLESERPYGDDEKKHQEPNKKCFIM